MYWAIICRRMEVTTILWGQCQENFKFSSYILPTWSIHGAAVYPEFKAWLAFYMDPVTCVHKLQTRTEFQSKTMLSFCWKCQHGKLERECRGYDACHTYVPPYVVHMVQSSALHGPPSQAENSLRPLTSTCPDSGHCPASLWWAREPLEPKGQAKLDLGPHRQACCVSA